MMSICFVCLGNICRSPTAEGVMRKLVAARGLSGSIHIESAGTGAWHVGHAADARACSAAARRGYSLDGHARQFTPADFARFDYVLAADAQNVANLVAMATSDEAKRKIFLVRDFDRDAPEGSEVPDPYYGGPAGFEQVLDICEAACRGLLEHLMVELALP
jgi:protein-tyrosine phosphatase